MRLLQRIFLVVLNIVFTNRANSQTVTIQSEKELIELNGESLTSLIIDFRLDKYFDYSQIPIILREIRFLKPSRNLSESGVLIEKLGNIRVIELNGKMSEMLPEIVFHCLNLDTVILTNTRLSHIWEYTSFINNRTLEVLILKDFEIDEKCMMYKRLFNEGSLTVRKIILTSNKNVPLEKQTLLMDVFGTKELWINGIRQEAYPNFN